jgi:hypothetical protein
VLITGDAPGGQAAGPANQPAGVTVAGCASCHMPAALPCQAATRVLFHGTAGTTRGDLGADDLGLVVAARQRNPGPGAARVAAVCLVRVAR